MKQQQPGRQAITTPKKLFLVSTIVLTVALLIFLIITMSGMYQLNGKIKLTTEHPFVVSRLVGEVRTDVAQMRIRTERLQSYNQSADIEKVRKALNELYLEVKDPLQEIQRLYLGPAADADLLANTCNDIQKYQKVLLDLAEAEGWSKKQIIAYEEKWLYPLYDIIEEGVATILAYTQNTQMTVYRFSEALWRSTLFLSVVIMLVTICGLILFQYVLGRMNQEIYYKNQQFDTLSHTIDETFLIFEEKNIVCDFVAENAIRVLGLSAKDLQNNRMIFYDCVDVEIATQIKAVLADPKQTGVRELAVPFVNPQTQEKRWLLLLFYKTGDGDRVKNIVTVVDQTEDILAREALQDALTNAQNANNAKRDFLSRMSHEIRTPMNAIIGMTTIAGASMENPTRVEDCLAKISYSSKHLLLLINDILDMSRIESNKLAINNEPFDLYQFMNSFLSVVYTQGQAKEIALTEKMIGFTDNTTFIGDSMRLNQILLNLVSNALKFTEPGGKVTLEVKHLSTEKAKETIRFTVADTGIGMSEDAIKRLYDPFDQADATIAQKYGGTGLGMSITKNLVSLMGGFIQVESQLGKGTTCVVEMPFQKSDLDLEVLPQEDLAALHVLIVDDERDMCEHASLLLTKINIRSQWVLTGEEAIDRVENALQIGDRFDICFIDWSMPVMNGLETAKKIRQRVGPDTPIIIISAYDWSDIEADARAAGVSAFISKPLFLSSIYNALVSVTNGSFARAASQDVEETQALAGKTILIAEDNELNLEIAQALLEMNGAIVECTRDGQEVGDRFLMAPVGYFDAILMDIQMPVLNGYEATQRIRNFDHPHALTIPIIATTANAFSEDVSTALAAGMNAHVSKPIDVAVLCQVLSQFI